MTSLITGGSGFLGSSIARELISQGENVVLFNRSGKQGMIPDSIVDKVVFEQGDLACWAEVLDVVSKHKVDTIYHCGALLSGSAEESPLKAYEVNTLGTWYILEAARLFDVKKVLFVSSIASFGSYIEDPVPNTAPQYPSTLYGVSKVSSERLGEYYKTKFDVNFRGVRFPSVIGPKRGEGGASAYSSLVFEKAVLGEPYSIYVEPNSKIPLLYIKDAVKALIELGNADENSLNYRMYNIRGFSPTAKQIVEEIKEILPDAEISFDPNQDMINIVDGWPDCLDDSEAQNDWGWKNDYNIKDTLLDFKNELEC
ncbi:NAD-dependent epimerase/dehydratase family protein [Natranaerofaba carboxydovora]|uniref:NAD-dependent epimerase/dehydratase family protein n=1 Tax=Natranaerofaba carboxydovora TaxID=2742683 RepID=UPI001F130DC7|nr:NAD-dependent epimerase/dehydratase family protein [Natranaerofaba carboxydovora]UMZ74123.1 putative epimerase/dehydratase [Natranaerofaba carboxydovora]